MGYDLHITRKEYHWDENGPAITSEEWLNVVNEDPELSIDDANGPYFTIWSGKCSYPDPWFDWDEGNIYTKNPDEPIIAKMLEISKIFNAKVQGDDGEVYTRPTKNGYL